MKRLDQLPVGQEPTVGRRYLVPAIDLSRASFGPQIEFKARFEPHRARLRALPISGRPHTDPEFPGAGGELRHLHIDNRFVSLKLLKLIWLFDESSLDRNFPILPMHSIGGDCPMGLRPMRCLRQLSDMRRWRPTSSREDYAQFEKKMAGLRLDLEGDALCPHHGTSLKGRCVRDGVVTCPLHGANWCAMTGRYVQKETTWTTTA